MRVRLAVALIVGAAVSSGPPALYGQPANIANGRAAAQPAAGNGAAPAGVIPTTAAAKHRQAVFRAYVAATRVFDWKKAAGYFDPQVLAELQALMAKTLREAGDKPEGPKLLKLFGGVGSVEEFESLTPAEAFAGFMKGLTESIPALKQAITNAQFEYLGEVQEKPELVHLIYRTRLKVGGIDSAKVTASSMVKTPDGWRLLLDDEVKGFAKMLEQQVSGSAPPAAAP